MPRIAATLGVFGLVVVSLGLNMAQFPIECIAVVPDPESREAEAADSPAEAARTPPVVACEPASAEPSQNGSEPEQAETAVHLAHDDFPTHPGYTAHADHPFHLDHPAESDDMDQEPGGSPNDKPDEQTGGPFTGGIYNPLEPQPESAVGRSGFTEAPPEVPADLTPAEAIPDPPYGTSGPTPVTAGRAMVPIEPETARERGESTRAEPVTRLPPVGAAWPAVPADHPLNPASPCSDRHYPATGAACRLCDATEDANGANQ